MSPITGDRLTHLIGAFYPEWMARSKLEKLLKKKGVSKRQFAKRMDMAYNNVFRICKETYDPHLSALKRWAKALEMKTSQLVKELLDE